MSLSVARARSYVLDAVHIRTYEVRNALDFGYSVVRERRNGIATIPKSFSKPRGAGFVGMAGGAERVRTVDLRLAKPALSQLSYSPEQWARADLNCRPHAYQACALTT